MKYASWNFDELEKYALCQMDKFERKIYLGRNLKIIIEKHGLNTHAFPENMNEALKAYEHYGKNMQMGEINWKGWQKEFKTVHELCIV